MVVLAIACDAAGPTMVCGCPPSFWGATVAGTVIDASGAPVPGARLVLQGFAPGFAPPPGPVPDGLATSPYLPKTDAHGKFVAEVYGHSPVSGVSGGSAELDLWSKTFLPGADTPILVMVGKVTFQLNSVGPDTARVTVTLPPQG
jgi:hypothetical protein